MPYPLNIMVFVKEVPDTQAVFINSETGTLKRESAGVILNPHDEAPVKLALRLKAAHGARITALSMGPKRTEGLMRYLSSLGFDRCVLLNDPAFAGSDTLATSTVLAAAVRFLGMPDLLLFGEQSSDGDTGQVPGQTAELLGIASFSRVQELVLQEGGFRAVQRFYDDEICEKEQVFPAALSLLPLNQPFLFFPEARNFFQATPCEILKKTDLFQPSEITGFKASPTRVIKVFAPTFQRKPAEILSFSSSSVFEIALKIKKKNRIF